MPFYIDDNSLIENKTREVLLYSDLDQTSDGPASKGYVDAHSGGMVVTTIEVDLGRTPLSRGTFTVTDAGVTSTTKIMIWQAMSSLTGKGSLADENEMDTLLLKATAGTGNFKVNWEANEGFVLAPVIAGGFVKGGILTSRPNTGAYPTADINRLFRTVKLGKVVGRFKFNYIKI
jgi:hypothetical protein